MNAKNTPEQAAADAAFIEKIKTLFMKTAPAAQATPCNQCGQPLNEHKLVGFQVSIKAQRPKRQQEQSSFAA